MPDLQVVITGRVQGVGFRWFVRSTARRLGVAGWAMNLPDGSVRVAARGPQGALDALMAALRAGPAAARVATVRPEPADPAGTLPDPFEIR
ncbi:MAG: acylphosphatase [Gemmatimonadales bacterium]|nr:acylphosphatase [Gemmatimonadales bacterium]